MNSRAFGVIALTLAMVVAVAACNTPTDGTSNPNAPTIGGPQLAVGQQDQLDIVVVSDAELYEVDETAHFTVTISKNGEPWEGDATVVEATFPDESTPVSLTPVALGVYSYDAALTSEGQKTLTVSATHDYASAIAAMQAKIINLQAEVADLEAQLAAETDPNKQRVLQAKIDNRLAMIDKFEEKIANMTEPMATGMKTITVESPAPPVSLTWYNVMNGVRTTQTALTSDTLGEALVAVLPALGIPPSQEHLYDVGVVPGAPLDESKTLAELGLTANGTVLYVWRITY